MNYICVYNLNISSSKFEGADLANSVNGECLTSDNSYSKSDLIVKPCQLRLCKK